MVIKTRGNSMVYMYEKEKKNQIIKHCVIF